MTTYEPKRGDYVEVVGRSDGWLGLRGIVTGPGDSRTITPFYRIKFPKWDSPDGPCKTAQFMASQLRPLVVLDPTKPPRIPEPGLWGVVEDRSGRRFLRDSLDRKREWLLLGTENHLGWDEIDIPTLVREGVESNA